MYFHCYVYVFLLYVYVSSTCQLALFRYPDWCFSVLFPWLYGKCQGITRKDRAQPALFQNFCCSIYCLFCVILCIVCVCKCVMYYCHWVSTQLQLTNIYQVSFFLQHLSNCSPEHIWLSPWSRNPCLYCWVKLCTQRLSLSSYHIYVTWHPVSQEGQVNIV